MGRGANPRLRRIIDGRFSIKSMTESSARSKICRLWLKIASQKSKFLIAASSSMVIGTPEGFPLVIISASGKSEISSGKSKISMCKGV